MSAAATAARKEELHRRGLVREWFTVAWNVIEGVVAIGAGMLTGSVSLVAFGADSFIEVISAVALLWRLRKAGPHASAKEDPDPLLAGHNRYGGIRSVEEAEKPFIAG